MNFPRKQGQLFPNSALSPIQDPINQELNLDKTFLEDWQKKIYAFQSDLFLHRKKIPTQGSLFNSTEPNEVDACDPLKLTPLPINFWRWPKSLHKGPAIYLVMDHPEILEANIYVSQ